MQREESLSSEGIKFQDLLLGAFRDKPLSTACERRLKLETIKPNEIHTTLQVPGTTA